MKELVCFDVCGTLYYSNTTFDFLAFFFEGNRRYKNLLRIIMSIPFKAISKVVFLLTGVDIIRKIAIYQLKGISEEKIKYMARVFVKEKLNKIPVKIAHELLYTAKNDGLETCLISASLDILIEPIAEQIKVDSWHATKLLFIEGVCTGKFVDDLYGKKNTLVLWYKNKYNRVSFITDNFNDIDIKEIVDDFKVVSFKKDRGYWLKSAPKCYIYEK